MWFDLLSPVYTLAITQGHRLDQQLTLAESPLSLCVCQLSREAGQGVADNLLRAGWQTVCAVGVVKNFFFFKETLEPLWPAY